MAHNEQWYKKSCLKDVHKSVENLSPQGESFSVSTKGFFLGDEYRNTFKNSLGLDNHFQGISYIPKKNIVVISGAKKRDKSASLFIIEKSKKPQLKLRYDIKIEDELWHAGGIAFSDEVLVLPMERFKPSLFSRIYFLSFKDPYNVRTYSKAQTISDNKAGSSDLIYDPNLKKNILFAFDTKEIKIFQEKTHFISGGFDLIHSIKTEIFKGSNMKVLQQCDGEVYIANLTNTGLVPPFINSKNQLTLYHYNNKHVEFDEVLKKNFECGKDCNFRGAASLISENNSLNLISSKMYLEKKQDIIKFKIFN